MRDKELVRVGDRVRVWKEFDVADIWYSEVSANFGVITPDGYKYGYVNWNIEKVNKEESMAEFKEDKITSYSQLKRGDRVRITREFEVTTSDMWDGVKSKDNRKYRIAAAESSSMPGFEVVKLTRLEPENWPPQLGDIWSDPKSGTEYHISTENWSKTLIAKPADQYSNQSLTRDDLKRRNPELKYRPKNTKISTTKSSTGDRY